MFSASCMFQQLAIYRNGVLFYCYDLTYLVRSCFNFLKVHSLVSRICRVGIIGFHPHDRRERAPLFYLPVLHSYHAAIIGEHTCYHVGVGRVVSKCTPSDPYSKIKLFWTATRSSKLNFNFLIFRKYLSQSDIFIFFMKLFFKKNLFIWFLYFETQQLKSCS